MISATGENILLTTGHQALNKQDLRGNHPTAPTPTMELSPDPDMDTDMGRIFKLVILLGIITPAQT
jgi:hypothetical protein